MLHDITSVVCGSLRADTGFLFHFVLSLKKKKTTYWLELKLTCVTQDTLTSTKEEVQVLIMARLIVSIYFVELFRTQSQAYMWSTAQKASQLASKSGANTRNKASYEARRTVTLSPSVEPFQINHKSMSQCSLCRVVACIIKAARSISVTKT